MTEELEAVAGGEGGHFRHDHRRVPAAAQPRQVGVVDDALPGRAAPEQERLVQEALHHEAVEDAVELQIPPLGVAEVQQAGDHPRRLVPQLHLVHAGVVLHLQPRLVGHVVAARVGGLAQPQLPRPPRQGGIADGNLCFLDQLLVDPLQPAAALAVQPPQQVGIDRDLVFPRPAGRGAAAADHRPHGVAADFQLPADGRQRHPGQMQLVNGITHVRIDHRTLSSFLKTRGECPTPRRRADSPAPRRPGSPDARRHTWP